MLGSTNPVGVGGGINYIGKHAYANSGQISVDTNETTMLEFNTGNEYIVSDVQFSAATAAGDNCNLTVRINEEIVTAQEFNNTYTAEPSLGYPVQILIPPFSKVKISLTMASGTIPWHATLVGEVYQ